LYPLNLETPNKNSNCYPKPGARNPGNPKPETRNLGTETLIEDPAFKMWVDVYAKVPNPTLNKL
jgi:hypothetical protein